MNLQFLVFALLWTLLFVLVWAYLTALLMPETTAALIAAARRISCALRDNVRSRIG